MNLSLFSDYSLRVLMFAALKGDAFVLDEVTAAYGISRNHLAKVVHNLGKLGYLDTQRGRGGGIHLAISPDQIQLGKLVRQTESRTILLECFDPATNTCPLIRCCSLKGFLAEAMNAFYTNLDRHTLQDLVSGPFATLASAKLLTPKAKP